MTTITYRLLARSLAIVLSAALVLGPSALAQSPAPLSSPASQPAPSAQADPDLEARMPQSVGGQPLTITSRKGVGTFAGTNPVAIRSLVDGLAAQGKTLDDLSIAVAYNADYTAVITALRVPGLDGATLVGPILGMAPAEQIQQQPGTVGGKAVTAVTDSTGVQQFYASGDILWIVRAVDPALTEILTALP